jgi:3-oxoacyl-[acyl-carrier protein] reductase
MKRTVIITGGTKGLGCEIALAFGRSGHFVVALYASDDTAAEQWKHALAEIGAQGCALRQDVTVENAEVWLRPEIQEAENLTLIHNACAPFAPTPLHQLTWRDFSLGFEVAVKGGWLCAQALIRPMLKKGRGTIVNILTSAIASSPPKGFGAYMTAKQALRGLTLSLATEYGARGVRVFSASPGFMNTALTAAWDERLREMVRSGGARLTDPAAAGREILRLVESADVPGRGEDYPI